MLWAMILVTAVAGYLLGNLNGAILMSRLFAKEDVRSHGSGNAGLTNFIRNYGAGQGVFVILIDFGKAFAACWLGKFLLGTCGYAFEGSVLGGISVMVGHDFPALLGFKGGKGILSGFAIALAIDWRVGLLILVVFALAYLTTWYVSLGSVLAAAAFAVGFLLFHGDNIWAVLGGCTMAALAIYMHRGNIQRLLKGEERKTNLFAGRKKHE